jgi:NAD(P)-dependent dehydrogenase (short-subunit alcohol dehydrogenase family)
MGLKDQVSKAALEASKAEHAAKRKPAVNHIMMTGDERPRSIGEAIRHRAEFGGAHVTSLRCDVRDEINLGETNHDTLIMCHGVMNLNWFENASPKKMREIIDVNLFGTMNVAQAFVRASIGNPHRKTIISIGSMAYTKVLNGSAAYCASKAGAAMAMKCLAWELAPKGFDVYSIHPSNVEDTPMSDETVAGLMSYRDLSHEDAISYWRDTCLRSSQLTKGEIAHLAWQLYSNNSTGFLSGSNLELSGGQR